MTPSTTVLSSIDVQLFQTIPGKSVLLLPDSPYFTIVAVTNDHLQLTGRDREELVGTGLLEAFPSAPDDIEKKSEQAVRASFAHVLEKVESHRLAVQRYDITGADGSFEERYWSTVTFPVLNENGDVIYLIHTTEDVTDQIKAEQKEKELGDVHSLNRELQFVTDTMPQLVWATEANGYAYFFNKGWLEYTGLTMEDVKGDGWIQSLHPDDMDRTIDAWTHAYRDGATYEIEYRLRRYDGEYRWFLTRGTPMKNEQGEIVKWYGTTTDVHEQRKVAEALKESHDRFNLVAKATQDAIWDWNLVTDEIWWNEGFRTMFGYAEEEIEPTIVSWYNRVHPDDKERIVGGIHNVIDNGGKQWSDEYRFRKKDGTYAIVFDRGHALHDAHGKPCRMLGSMQDITQRKKAEDALNYQKTLLETVTSNTTLALFMLNNERECIYMNEAAEQMTGFSFLEISGKNLHYTIHHSHPDGSPYPVEDCPMVCALPQGEQREGEEIFIHKNGQFYTVAYTASPIVLNGNPIGTVLEARDITEEKKREQQLRENETRFRQMANSLPIVIWTAAPDGNLTFISDQWEKEFGNPIAESLGTGWAKFVHPDDIDHAAKVWELSLIHGHDYEVEFRVTHKSGDYRWLLVRASAIRDNNGVIIQWYGSNTDIEDKKQFEEQLEKRVKERTQEIERFTFASHHDLQEPLRKIIMFTDLVKSESYNNLPESARKRLDKVTDAAARMSQALKDVLNFASLDKEEQFKMVSLKEVLASVESDLELVIQEKSATISTSELPTVKAIPSQMHQLFYNLVNNALKFAKAGVPPVVSITCHIASSAEVAEYAGSNQDKQFYRIEVQDNGIGFNQSLVEKIFTLFQRLHSKDAYSGTGIGLALCRKVVQNHEGYISAESVPGEGAAFIVLLPVN